MPFILLLLAALACASPSSAQVQLAVQLAVQPAAAPPASPTAYKDEAAVVEQDDAVYQYAGDGSSTHTETAVVRLQSSAALQFFAVLGFPYASANQRLEIVYARVRKPDGTVVETPSADAQDQPAQATQIAPMYSDLHVKQLPVRSLAVGDTLDFQVRTTQQQPEIPGQFWGQENFGAGLIYLERSVELHVPAHKQLTVFSPKNPPRITELGGERVYRWTGAQLRSPSAKDEPDPPLDTLPPIAWTTFPSWEAVGLWYRGLIQGRDAVTPAIQAKADELTAKATTDTEKVRALYEYVSAHNHYIGIDFGIGRYQPHTAAEVLANQYGDCKDKHTLLAALLKAKGFEVSAVLIGAGIELNEKVPSPAAFNHLITRVQVQGEPVWLDATSEVAPYRALLPLLRDKQALVIPPSGAPSLIKTPAQLPYPAVMRYQAKSELDASGSLKGHIEVELRGDDEVLMRMAARQYAPAQWDQLSQNYSNGFGFSGTTSATMLDPADDTAGPWHIRFDYSKSPFGDWGTFRIASLLPNLELPTIDEKKPPKKEIEFGGPRTVMATSTIHLPQGYSVELPDAVHVKSDFATFDKTYQLKEGSLVSDFKLVTLLAKLPATKWKEYKKFLDDAGEEPWIQLTSREHVPGEKGPPLTGENNPAAAELVTQAQQALTAHDVLLARQKLDKAAAINDKQRSLWVMEGYVEMTGNFYDKAIADYQRELQQYPDETNVYPALAFAQGRARKTDDQAKTLLAYAKAEPGNAQAIFFAGHGLLTVGHLNEAVEVFRAGVKANPDNRLMQVSLATALFRAGKPDEATPIARAAIDGTTDPDVLNDGAYTLADHEMELPLAETSARKAVDLLEAESAQATIDTANTRSFRRTALLLASWDTLGWIYFREGKTELAQPYVRAAWQTEPHAEVGLHYGQILLKLGDRAQAMQVFELAASSYNGTVESPIKKDLDAHIEALSKQGTTQTRPKAAAVFQEQRTFHVPRPAEAKGSAIFLTQVSAAGTEKVELVSGDQALASLAAPIQKLDLRLAVPKDSHALLLRSGVLFCSTQPTCEFVLTPPETANVK